MSIPCTIGSPCAADGLISFIDASRKPRCSARRAPRGAGGATLRSLGMVIGGPRHDAQVNHGSGAAPLWEETDGGERSRPPQRKVMSPQRTRDEE